MSPAERDVRTAAAIARIQATSAGAMNSWYIAQFSAWVFRTFLHVSIGFGVCVQTEISMWFGLPIALLSANTVGRFVEWWRRDAMVKAIEDYATTAEKTVKKGAK